jgi:hypothetical protein
VGSGLVPTEAGRDVVELRLQRDQALVEDFEHLVEVVAADFEARHALFKFDRFFEMVAAVAWGLVGNVARVSDGAPATGSQRGAIVADPVGVVTRFNGSGRQN